MEGKQTRSSFSLPHNSIMHKMCCLKKKEGWWTVRVRLKGGSGMDGIMGGFGWSLANGRLLKEEDGRRSSHRAYGLRGAT